jgi:hypothetical protein
VPGHAGDEQVGESMFLNRCRSTLFPSS